MQFGEMALDKAQGAILAHRVKGQTRTLKKGHRLDLDDLADLRAAGLEHVLGAKLDAGDVGEDEAAAAIAVMLDGGHVRLGEAFTGRANVFAASDGLLDFDPESLHALNRLDERITIATLPHLQAVRSEQMLATVKIIPFAVPRPILDQAITIAAKSSFALLPYQPKDVCVIQTRLPATPTKVLDKTFRVTAGRLTPLQLNLRGEQRCAHERPALATTIAHAMLAKPAILLITGASAITDRGDILPKAIEDAGGEVDYFGMPVDPGNLLLMAHIGQTTVLGMPGCARSPKLNGFDWVLQRLAAGTPVTPHDIQAMGVGGLLSEIPSRPQPRLKPEPPKAKPNIVGLVLAAGQSRRMGTRNKLLIELQGKTLVQHAVDALRGAGLESITVVSGHEAERLEQALATSAIEIVHNPEFATGLASSLRYGTRALPPEADGVVVALGDMPLVNAALITRLIEAFDPSRRQSIVVPTVRGKRGNPVLWGARYFEEMEQLSGDVGAKHLIGLHGEEVFEVACDDEASLLDLDTPQALAAFEAAS